MLFLGFPYTKIKTKQKINDMFCILFYRSSSLSHSPDQRSRSAFRPASRRTPPTTRGCLNAIGESRDSGPAYQHLQEVDSSERESVKRLVSNIHLLQVNELNANYLMLTHSPTQWINPMD